MLIYKDVFSGDEMLSDSYPCTEVDDGCGLEVQTKMIVVGEEDFGISANVDEDAPEGAEAEAGGSTAEKVNDVVHGFNLNETVFTKKEFQIYIKGYMKKVKAYLEKEKPERVDPFMKGATTIVKRILGDFKNYQFFCGSSYDMEAGLALMFYKEDGMIPYILYFKDGLLEEKA